MMRLSFSVLGVALVGSSGIDAKSAGGKMKEFSIVDTKVGTGPEIKDGAAVVVHYRMILAASGKEIESSYAEQNPVTYQKGMPSAFRLNVAIEGVRKGIIGMKLGGKRTVTIPSVMGYGDRAIQGEDRQILIPPHSGSRALSRASSKNALSVLACFSGWVC